MNAMTPPPSGRPGPELQTQSQARFWTIVSLIVIAVFSRLLPHPPNFTALGAVSLFAGGVLLDRRLALCIPLLTLWLSDLLVNNVLYAGYYEHFVWAGEGVLWSYAGYALIVLLGHQARVASSPARMLGGSLAAAIIFFVMSNFGVWYTGLLYPLTGEGLVACFVAAIPFFANSLAAQLIFGAALFGALHLLDRRLLQRAHA